MITVLYRQPGWDFWHTVECASQRIAERVKARLIEEGYQVV